MPGIIIDMIKDFKDKDAKALYEGRVTKKFRSFRQQAEKRLQILDMATKLSDLRGLPSNRFEALQGNRKGQYSVRINKQWRICFKWADDGPYDVEIVDYH